MNTILIESFDFEAYPLWAFRNISEKPIEGIRKKTKTEPSYEEKEERAILCRNCKHQITSFKHIIEVRGQHRHTFGNPEGFVFEIGCFSAAKGCRNEGVPTSEFTWFSGFSWRYAICAKCYLHLGWHYLSRGEANFYGLILNRLIQG